MNDYVTLEKANNASYYSPFFMKYKLVNGMFASLAYYENCNSAHAVWFAINMAYCINICF